MNHVPGTRECFVISPFEKRFDRIFRKIIHPLITDKFKTPCTRADHSKACVPIAHEIFEKMAKAKFIIAELTTLNANVLYELGIAHTMGKRVVMITQEIEKLPFDIKHIRVVEYDDDETGWEKFTKELEEAVNEILENEWINNPLVKYYEAAPFRYLTHIDELVEIENESEGPICIITWDLINDLNGAYKETIVKNLGRGVKYNYILPKKAEIEMQTLLNELETIDKKLKANISANYVTDSQLECTVVIYGAGDDGCDRAFIMPSAVNTKRKLKYSYEYAYEVRDKAKDRIYKRFQILWNHKSHQKHVSPTKTSP